MFSLPFILLVCSFFSVHSSFNFTMTIWPHTHRSPMYFGIMKKAKPAQPAHCKKQKGGAGGVERQHSDFKICPSVSKHTHVIEDSEVKV